MKNILNVLFNKLKQEPALIIGAVASIVVAVAAKLNIVIDEASLVLILTPLVTGLLTRSAVVPVFSLTEGSDDVAEPVEEPVVEEPPVEPVPEEKAPDA